MGQQSDFHMLENILLAWYQMAWPSIIPVDHNILNEKDNKVAINMQFDSFDV